MLENIITAWVGNVFAAFQTPVIIRRAREVVSDSYLENISENNWTNSFSWEEGSIKKSQRL